MYKCLMALLCLLLNFNGISQVVAPALSPSANFTQKVGLSTIQIDYSRPSLRGRKLFGNEGVLIKGESWRTGANRATKLTLDDDISIAGNFIEKGSYAILTIPNEEDWELLLYNYDSGSWQSYLKKVPVLELKSQVINKSESKETFLISLENIKLGSADLIFSWGNKSVAFPIATNLEEKMSKMISREIAGPSLNDYFQAALYYHEAGIELETALTYVRKVTQSESALFFHVFREASILKDLGRGGEAVLVATRSKELSEKAGNSDLVRLSQQIIDHFD